MTGFTFNTTPSVRMGAGLFNTLGDVVAPLVQGRVLLVTDAGMIATGFVEKATQSLVKAGLEPVIYDGVLADPPEAVIHAAAELAKTCMGVIGLGGGSSLDVAKLAALLAGSGEDLAAAYGVGQAKGPRLPLILVPTTAGTGSEVTPISIVTTGESEKMGVVSPVLLPDVALLDPELTIGLPALVTAATGIDAMVHAIEAYTSASPNNNPVSRSLALEALRLMGQALETAVSAPDDLQARSDMLLGSMLAGQAFANAPVAAVHALAYPIGGHFKVPHGLSNALVLPHVIRFNTPKAGDDYSVLAAALFPGKSGAFADQLTDLSRRCGVPQTLAEVGIASTDLDLLAHDAMNQNRLLVNNPREVTLADARAIYEAAL
ncbi:iron-containing alcohol dehydrogenase [Algirhabdus cladophorae]|uniref:iron-containing alcohol dehydrogenase n=1 Tax=Algirhabdus cladophorae TaxID=3377108 RepID=UPI003B849CCD